MNLGRYLLEETQVFPIVRTETSQRENAPKAATTEKDKQRRAQSPTGHRIAEKHNEAADVIELRPMLHVLPDAKRHTDQIAQHKTRQAEENGNRKSGLNDVPYRILINVGAAEVQMHDVPKPQSVTDMHRLVEAVITL